VADLPDSAATRCVGILCGGGLLPLRVAQSLRAGGARVVAICIEGEADPAVEELADEVHWTGLARLGGWISILKKAGSAELLMCGSVRKGRMFGRKAALLPDWRSVKLWYSSMATKGDHTILGAIVAEFEKEGIRVRTVPECCPDLMAPAGCLTRREPSRGEWADIRFAWPIVKQVAALQIGQCLVVKERAVVAVEGIDGTDATLERGGALAGKGAIAVKVAKDGHDDRFDIPSIGPDTVDMLQRTGIDLLAVEAGRTILLDSAEIADRGDRAGICVIAVDPEQIRETVP
jgi:DUF1009 family protein